MFAGVKGTTAAEITDGADRTILIVESKRDIPWTKPDDIPFDASKPLPELGGIHAGRFWSVHVNGGLWSYPTTKNPQEIKALFTKAAGDSPSPPNSARPR